MTPEHKPPLVDLAPLGWSASRIAAALAVAGPNNHCIARAAVEQLTLDDHVAAFAAWCDTQAGHAPRGRP